MKRTLLSVSVALACTVSNTAFAAGASDETMTFWDEAQQFGGHIGASYEYEDKKTTDFDGNVTKERFRTAELLNLAYTNAIWDFSALYSFKTVEGQKDTPPAWQYTEKTDAVTHVLTLDKSFNLSGGWSGGLLYALEYTDGEIESISGWVGTSLIDYTNKEHTVKPYLNYWSNKYLAGVELSIDYLNSENDKTVWGVTESDAYSLLVKPFKRIGNWELGVEFYYQTKDTTETSSTGSVTKSEFTEKYFEPIAQYSFEDAGTLYARARIGENKTQFLNGGDTYFKDIRKGTIGYQQLLTQDWEVKAEYEFAKDTETTNASGYEGKEKVYEQDKLYVSALYRF